MAVILQGGDRTLLLLSLWKKENIFVVEESINTILLIPWKARPALVCARLSGRVEVVRDVAATVEEERTVVGTIRSCS